MPATHIEKHTWQRLNPAAVYGRMSAVQHAPSPSGEVFNKPGSSASASLTSTTYIKVAKVTKLDRLLITTLDTNTGQLHRLPGTLRAMGQGHAEATDIDCNSGIGALAYTTEREPQRNQTCPPSQCVQHCINSPETQDTEEMQCRCRYYLAVDRRIHVTCSFDTFNCTERFCKHGRQHNFKSEHR